MWRVGGRRDARSAACVLVLVFYTKHLVFGVENYPGSTALPFTLFLVVHLRVPGTDVQPYCRSIEYWCFIYFSISARFFFATLRLRIQKSY